MPNIPQQETIVQYVANSAQTAYTFAFYAPEETDIEVYYQASNATPVPAADILDLSTDYTVTYNSDPITGGTITLLFTPTTGYYLTINRNVLASLNTNFAAAQTLSGQTLDTAFDRLLLLCQQNQNYALERNLSYIINTYLPNASPYTQLPTLAQNYIWVGSGAGVTSALLASTPSASVLQSLLAANGVGVDGARLVGYYNVDVPVATTVHDYLAGDKNRMQFGYYTTIVTDTGTANVYEGAADPAYENYGLGMTVRLRINHTNTSSTCTLNINGLGAVAIKLGNENLPLPGSITAKMFADFVYNDDGAYIELQNPQKATNTAGLYASAFISASTAFSGTSAVKVLFDSVEFDTYAMFNAGLNRFIVPAAGKYRISATLAVTGAVATGGNFMILYLLKNGALIKRICAMTALPTTLVMSGDVIVSAAASDYFEIYMLQSQNNANNYADDGIGGTPQQCSQFAIEFIGT